MDNDDKSNNVQKSLNIKKPVSRNSSLTRQESKKEVKPSINIKSTSNSSITNIMSNNPYDPRNLNISAKNSTKKLTTFGSNNKNTSSQPKLNEKDSNQRQSFKDNSLNSS